MAGIPDSHDALHATKLAPNLQFRFDALKGESPLSDYSQKFCECVRNMEQAINDGKKYAYCVRGAYMSSTEKALLKEKGYILDNDLGQWDHSAKDDLEIVWADGGGWLMTFRKWFG